MANAIRIRMYRPGFGDCFLLSFGDAHVLIDFGAHMHGDIGTMDAIMDDIEKETAKKLALVVATHAHRDHISGFGKFAARFAGFDVKEVWLPWTDDPSDADAKKLNTKHLALYDQLDQHFRLSPAAAGDDAKRRAVATDALSNLRGNEAATSALARGLGTGDVKYLQAGTHIGKAAGVVGLSAEILSPPKDASFLGRMNPPAAQRYLTDADDPTSSVHPFVGLEVQPKDVVAGQPTVSANDLQRLHALSESPAEALALTLDSARNNTSLVILFRFGGKALLFPGDAQWGSWQSWIGTTSAHALIGELDFLKIAHHGSENATPVDVVEALRAQGLAAMVSTQVDPFPTIPRMELIAAIETHHTTVVRSDWIKVGGVAKEDPKAPAKLPGGFAPGEVWIDYTL